MRRLPLLCVGVQAVKLELEEQDDFLSEQLLSKMYRRCVYA